MRKLILPVVTIVGISATGAIAETQTSTLSITTIIQASCDVLSPSGTLNLPFDPSKQLSAQSLAATPVRVTVNCQGNPVVNHVDFGVGVHRPNVAAETNVRYMKRSSAGTSSAGDYLGYLLFAVVGTSPTSTQIHQSANSLVGTGFQTQDNRLLIDSPDASFSVTGKIFEFNERAGAFGDPTQPASGSAVRGGSYSDSVVMTLSYN